MELTLYQIDAFTDELFKGNPAAVMLLNKWLPDEVMQNIAAENNLAETAFVLETNNQFEIRWFTPEVEVDLCGHATLASAYVLFSENRIAGETIEFQSARSGKLTVTKLGEELTLDFPADEISKYDIPSELKDAFGYLPSSVYKGKTDFLFEFKDENEILNLNPDLKKIKAAGGRGVIATAPGIDVDFVSRFFAPQSGIDEDPVTGSSHTSLTPFWSNKLKKEKLTAKQLSKRGGQLTCELKNDRVLISGKAKIYLKGSVYITDK